MQLVLGLGNPGARYLDTRHNVGFLVADVLARRGLATIDREQHGALTAKVRLAGQPVLLAKPQGFMNLSGGPAQKLASYFSVAPSDVVVIHDELDLPFGEVRVKRGGGHNGHNGLRDLHRHLGTSDYIRIRVGISRPPQGWDTANYVLGRWTPEEASALEDITSLAANAVEAVLHDGVESAMSQFNGRAAAVSQG